MIDRQKNLSSLTGEILDILVIGGGIVGAGVARDAALRGLRVGLVERGDFASGTSSRSSRLLHGGIRYLAQGRIGLVREASVEKTILGKIAPHLTEPLAFLFPSYQGSGWPLWQLRIGVKIYDLLCGGSNFGKSRGLNKEETLDWLPGLKPSGLRGAVCYFDGFTNDARLVIDTLRSSANAGASVCNYLCFLNADRVNGLWQCSVSDRLSNEAFPIRARTIVNASGPWADHLPHSAVKLRLTKGIHIILDRSRLNFHGAVVITEGNRIIFIIPWGERVIVGTTDTDYEGKPEKVRVCEEDIRYLLANVNKFFPSAEFREADVISSWAGLRPLLADPSGKPSDISRSHEIRSPAPGWWDVSGGKLTTYRLMAEQTVDDILGSEGRRNRPTRTASMPLLQAGESQAISAVTPPAFTRENVLHFCHREWAVHLDDVMIRRTNWKYYHRNADELASKAAEWMAEALDWSITETEEELARYRVQQTSADELC